MSQRQRSTHGDNKHGGEHVVATGRHKILETGEFCCEAPPDSSLYQIYVSRVHIASPQNLLFFRA